VSRVEQEGFGHLPDAAAVARTFREVGAQAMHQVVEEAHGAWLREMEHSRRTGTSMRSLATEVTFEGDSVVGVVGSNYPPVRYVDEGTADEGRGYIYPKRAKALRFPEPGNSGFTLAGRQRSGAAGTGARWVFAKRVRGIRPRRYRELAAVAVRPQVEATVRGFAERFGAQLREHMGRT
jgi:hypothetical protein